MSFTLPESVDDILREAKEELTNAMSQHAPYNSYHEAYAVMLEELDEFWEIVRQKPYERNPALARKECMQIIATALRAIVDLELEHGPLDNLISKAKPMSPTPTDGGNHFSEPGADSLYKQEWVSMLVYALLKAETIKTLVGSYLHLSNDELRTLAEQVGREYVAVSEGE